jgi:hypothetical protein
MFCIVCFSSGSIVEFKSMTDWSVNISILLSQSMNSFSKTYFEIDE